MIEHPDLDPDVTLHLGDLEEGLVAGHVLVLEHEDAPDADLPVDRLALEFEVASAQVASPEPAVEAAHPGVHRGQRDRVDRVLGLSR